jgi:hypothetical protein
VVERFKIARISRQARENHACWRGCEKKIIRFAGFFEKISFGIVSAKEFINSC